MNGPRNLGIQNREMARDRAAGFESTLEEDLIDIHANPTNRNQNGLYYLLNPQRSFQPISPVHPERLPPWQRNYRGPLPTLPMAQRPQPQRPQSTAVFDLIDESDFPVRQRHSQPPSQIGRNLRQTNSQRIAPPSLSRSDSTFVGPEASFLDPTTPSPEDGRAPEPRITRSYRHHHHLPRTHQPIPAGHSFYSNIARYVQRMANHMDTDFMRRGSHITATTGSPLNFTPREPSLEPLMEPTSRPRDGFTRDTSSTEERTVVCPACNDELAYDPMAAVRLPSVFSANGRKRKRAPGEHHFWALKKCGHVYCADCFENRRPAEASPHGVGFRLPHDKTPNSASKAIRCAVENCETKAALQTEWCMIGTCAVAREADSTPDDEMNPA